MFSLRNRAVARRVTNVAAAALLACTGSVPALADVIERSMEVGAAGRLVLESDIGSVRVESHAANRVEITVEREGRDAQQLNVDIERRGNEVHVLGRLPKDRARRGGWSSGNLDVEYTVVLPRSFDADVRTAGGSVSIDDLDGEVEVFTAGGSIRLANLGGQVRAKTAGGSIDLQSSGGDVKLDTAGGSIRINRAGGTVVAQTAGGSISIDEADGSVEARTAGGSIRIGRSGGDVEAHTSGGSVSIDDVYGSVDASTAGGSINASMRSQPSGDSELRTFGGSVTVTLAAGLALDIDAYSSDSRIRTDFEFPADAWDDDETALNASLNGGGPELRIRASQRIRIRRE
jgi:hypothetical protein